MPKVNFIEYLRQGTLGCHYFPACSSGTSAAPQTFPFTPPSYSHWSHHYIQYAWSMQLFLFSF